MLFRSIQGTLRYHKLNGVLPTAQTSEAFQTALSHGQVTEKDVYKRQGEGKRYTKQAAMAKLFTSEHAMKTTTKVVQLCGGYGYTKDYPVERMMRDAKITEIYEGTSEIQRVVISGNILGK